MPKTRVRLKSYYHLHICFLQIVYILSCTTLQSEADNRHNNQPNKEYNEYVLVGDHLDSSSPHILHHNHHSHRHLRRPYRSHYFHHYHHYNDETDDEVKRGDRKRTVTTTSIVFDASTTASNSYANNSSGSSEAIVQRDYMAAVIGKDVQLDCRMKNLAHDDDKIVWLKMPKGEVLTLNSNRVTSDARVNTRCIAHSAPCWSLIIASTRETDTGFYVCQTNAMQTKYVYLDIMVPPKLLTQYPVDRIDVNQSSNATITCEFYGKPDPLIKWYRYNNGIQKEIEKFRGSKTISIYIHKDSASEYECVADNSIPPTVSKKIYLNIQYAPQIKFLNSKVFQKKGERVIFDCNVNSNPLSKIYWFKNHTRIYESFKFNFENLDDSYHRLYINNLTDGDFGDYYCTAVNMLGKSTSKIQLIELRPSNEHKKPTVNPFQWSAISSASSTSSSSTRSSSTTIVSADSSIAEASSLNETVIHISLNRDNPGVYDSAPIVVEGGKKAEMSSTRVKDAAASPKIAPSYRSNKHHLHNTNNRTKMINKNQRKQIQKPYINSNPPPNKHHHQQTLNNANSIDSSTSTAACKHLNTLLHRLFAAAIAALFLTI